MRKQSTRILNLVQRIMKSVAVKSIVLCITLMTVVHADDRLSEAKAEKQFPQSVVFDYNNEQLKLFLTGLAVRKKFFMKIYSMAHYIEQKPDASGDEFYQHILQQHGAKQIKMVFLRVLTAEQIQKSLITGFKLNTNKEEYLQIRPQVEKFLRAIDEDVKQNDEFIIRWLPDGTMLSIFQGEEISSIKNEQFASALWSIWFGNNSVVDRESLIKQMLTSS
jgi:RNase H-fold protein (predicted Holliday junction resolvase)